MFAEMHTLNACEENLSKSKRSILMTNNHIITAWQTSMVLVVFPFVYRLYVILKKNRIKNGLFITALITFFLIDSHLLKTVIASKHIIQQLVSVKYFNRESKEHDVSSEYLASKDTITAARGDVFVFDGVTYGYVEGQRVLDNMSFVARKHEVTCIIGPPGSGKSTIVSLLFKKIIPHSGSIRMYGEEDYSPSNMVIVSQMAILFNRTVYDNITYGTNASERDVQDLVEQFQLDTMFNKLTHGMETTCGFQGKNLSGGQKQMIHVLRSILSNSNVIVMDEPTSALDNATIAQYIRVIRHLKDIKDCVLIITHDHRIMNIADQLIRI
jgi:ABC-type multidrug transport system fused ATPase/permease subunit